MEIKCEFSLHFFVLGLDVSSDHNRRCPGNRSFSVLSDSKNSLFFNKLGIQDFYAPVGCLLALETVLPIFSAIFDTDRIESFSNFQEEKLIPN